MNTNRTTIRAAALATILAGAVTIGAATSVRADGDGHASVATPEIAGHPDPTTLTRDWMERRELLDVVAKMPAGWRATEVMQREARRPLGDLAARTRWRRTAERMPAGWVATEVMWQAAAWPPPVAP